MNKRPALVILAVVILLTMAAGMCPAATPNFQTSVISSIRQRYATINRNQAKYKRVKKDLLGFSTEGGEMVAYLDDRAVVKMVATFYGESGKAVEEYYYRGDQLIFVFRKESRYDKPLSGRVVSTQQQRFYFNNGQLIRWLDEKGKSVAAGPTFSSKQEELRNSSKELSEGARSPGSTIEARH